MEDVQVGQVEFLKDRKTLALIEVPFVSGKIQLRVQWKSGTFLPLFEKRIDSDFALEHFRTPMLLKLELIEDE